MRVGPANAWIVLAAWIGLMAGVGAAMRPASPVLLSPKPAAVQAEAWQAVLVTAPPDEPVLWLGDRPCACETGALRALGQWAEDAGLRVRPAPGMAGIALADATGALRYAGEPAALVAHCGGLRGFRAWWSEPTSRPILTAPCPCA